MKQRDSESNPDQTPFDDYLYVGAVRLSGRQGRTENRETILSPVVEVLTKEGFKVNLGDGSLGLAELWCAPDDHMEVVRRLDQMAKEEDTGVFQVHYQPRYTIRDWKLGKPMRPNKSP